MAKIQNFVYLFILAMALTSLASAYLGEIYQGECISLETVLNSSSVNITSISTPTPNSETTYLNEEMTKQGTLFNYTYCDTYKLGTYRYTYEDNDGNGYGNTFSVTTARAAEKRDITETSVLIAIALVVSIILFIKVNRFLGGFFIFLSGLGILFENPQNGWIGWIVIAIGFTLIITGFFEPIKTKRRF